MKIVSETSKVELARRKSMPAVSWAFRAFAANIMRVTRGAGNAHESGAQALKLVEELRVYREKVGHFPGPDEIADVLSPERDPEVMARMSAENRLQIYAERQII